MMEDEVPFPADTSAMGMTGVPCSVDVLVTLLVLNAVELCEGVSEGALICSLVQRHGIELGVLGDEAVGRR